MKFYYTLTCIVLPAAMMAACSSSGSKKPASSETNVAIIEKTQQTKLSKPVVPLTEKLNDVESIAAEIPESEKFPLTQIEIETAHNSSKPVKRIYQFGFDKHELGQSELASLQKHADYLIANSDAVLLINGHSDTQGNQVYNQFLSKERANKVAKILIEYGVSKSQIKVNGMGDSQPLNDVNNFKENRRVELEYQVDNQESRVAIK